MSSRGELWQAGNSAEHSMATQSTLERTVDWDKWSNNMVLRDDLRKGGLSRYQELALPKILGRSMFLPLGTM